MCVQERIAGQLRLQLMQQKVAALAVRGRCVAAGCDVAWQAARDAEEERVQLAATMEAEGRLAMPRVTCDVWRVTCDV